MIQIVTQKMLVGQGLDVFCYSGLPSLPIAIQQWLTCSYEEFTEHTVILSGVWYARSAEHTESKDPEMLTQRKS